MSLRELGRIVLPRSLRNALRRPSRTLAWARDEASFRLGRTSSCQLRNDWTLACHPGSVRPFLRFVSDPDQRAELDAFIARCTADMVLLDVGAHYGLFSLAALRYGGPGARAIAVEPSPAAVRVLSGNATQAGVRDRIAILQAASGASDSELAMLTTGPFADHYLVGTDEKRPDALRVPQETIPTLVARTGWTPTHVKIDVEGYESEVIQGGSEWLRDLRPLVFLELHSEILRRRGRAPSSVLDQMSACGYGRFEMDGRPIAQEEAAMRQVVRLVCLPHSP